MSIKEVIDRAAELGGWDHDYFGIRRWDGISAKVCPIGSLTGCRLDWLQGRFKLNLSFKQASRIAAAADNISDGTVDENHKVQLIRRYMLRKFGLQEGK